MILYFMLSVSKDLGLCFSLCEKIQPRETFEIVIASPSSEIPFSFFVAIQIQHQIAVPSLFYSYALLWKEITLGTALVEHDSSSFPFHLFTQTIHQQKISFWFCLLQCVLFLFLNCTVLVFKCQLDWNGKYKFILLSSS